MARSSSTDSEGTSSTRSCIEVKALRSSVSPSDASHDASSTPPTSLDPTPSAASASPKQSKARRASAMAIQSTDRPRSRRSDPAKQGRQNVKRQAGTDIRTPNKVVKSATKRVSSRTNGSVSIKGKLYATLDKWFSRQQTNATTSSSPILGSEGEESAPTKKSPRAGRRSKTDDITISDSEEAREREQTSLGEQEGMDIDSESNTITVSPKRSKKRGATTQEEDDRHNSKRMKRTSTSSESPKRATRTSTRQDENLTSSTQEAESGTTVQRTLKRLKEAVTPAPRRSSRQVPKEVPALTRKGSETSIDEARDKPDATSSTAQRGARPKFAKTMKTRGKFFSGEPLTEVFPEPNPFFMGKFGPFDEDWTNLKQARGFKLGAEVFNPQGSSFVREGKDWSVTRGAKNVFAGDAKKTWNKNEFSKLPTSLCMCKKETGCDENCLNRVMEYECDNTNCAVGASHCKNRPFFELSKRVQKAEAINNRQKEHEKKASEEEKRRPKYASVCMSFDQGVEVFETKGKGYGVRAQRSFEPGQIIMEYFGEIIDTEERDHRMNTVYKDSSDFYMMEFHNGFILDATKGSMCRFVNHSCEPNCEIRKMWVRNGADKRANVEPRMALFALDKGIRVDEELTYDYNFDPFSMQNAQKCLCGAAKCRGILGPRPPKDRKNGEQEKVDTKRATGVKQMKNGVIAQKVEKKVKTASTRSRR